MEITREMKDIALITSQVKTKKASEKGYYKDFFKRVFDLLLFVISLPIVFPILGTLMILVKLDSKGPAIYKSLRIGKNGKKFYCLKLRTMKQNADQELQEILDNDDQLKLEYETYGKLKSDPRITRIGKILRALSLDELPQIFNVLAGEMSFVGPRPALEAELPKHYGKESWKYTAVRPGITGPWQVNGRNEVSFQGRVTFDTQYLNQLSFLSDLKILAKTIPVAFSKRGAY